MKIDYSVDPRSKRTWAIGTAEADVEGVHPLMMLALSGLHPGLAKKVSKYPPITRATARPVGDDEYDEQAGRDVARDKLIIRYMEQQNEKLAAVQEALQEELEACRAQVQYNVTKIARAEHRLEEHM